MSGASESCEVAILGGGPAGATAARLLHLWGHRVLLLSRARPARLALAESLPPSVRKIARHVGIETELDSAGFFPTSGNTVWWGSSDSDEVSAPRVERFEGGELGLQVRSQELERLVLGVADRAGVPVLHDALVRDVAGLDHAGERALAVETEIGADREMVHADWLLDATGRAGVVARRGLRRMVEGRSTLALISRYRSERGFPLDDPSHTLVESYRDGWAWSVPVSEQERYVAVMVDPQRTELADERTRRAMSRGELAKTRALHEVLRRAEPVGDLLACDASTYTATSFCGPGYFLAGDAGSFIDPLSSFGVKKAMASGWLAAVCLHSLLTDSELVAPALELFDRRERAVFESHRRLSARYFDRADADSGSSFWSERAELDRSDDVALEGGADVYQLREDAEVLAAFAELKRRTHIDLVVGARVRSCERAIVVGDRVVLEEHLLCDWAPEGIRFLRGVELPRLLRLATEDCSQVGELCERYNRDGEPAPLPDLLGALSVCLAKGVLEHRQSG